MTVAPAFFEAFISPITDSTAAQVGICAVFLLIALDIIFGLINAFSKKEYSSAKMRQGIAHKSAELGFIIVGLIVDAAVVSGINIGFESPVLITICVYLCIMEIGSLLETFAALNPALADTPLFKLLESVTNEEFEIKEDEEEGEDD